MPKVLDNNGAVLTLGHLLQEGGEGKIFVHPNDGRALVKVYKEPNQERAAKLQALVSVKSAGLLEYAAWPLTNVFNEKRQGPIGFIMSKVHGHPIHQVYAPKERQNLYPKMGWSHLVHIAKNTAAAFHNLHEQGVVIGDVNEQNFLVADNGTVHLIDCDSYQVTYGATTYRCAVGVSTWTPPELQGQAFSQIDRTPNHDLFGLAILIFQLLFIGRHPFASKREIDCSLEEAIERRLFAYSSALTNQRVAPPPKSLSPNAVGTTVFSLFEQAFLAGSPYGEVITVCPNCQTKNRAERSMQQLGQPTCGQCQSSLDPLWNERRPDALQWATALEELKNDLVACGRNNLHSYIRGTTCPFCSLEQENFFAFAATYQNGTNSSGVALGATSEDEQNWRFIYAYSPPNIEIPTPPPMVASGRPLPRNITKFRWAFLGGIILLLVSVGLLFYSGFAIILGLFAIGICSGGTKSEEYKAEIASRQRTLDQKTTASRQIVEQIERIRQNLQHETTRLKSEAKGAFDTLNGLKKACDQEMTRLHTNKRETLINEYLDHQLLSRRKFPNIGPQRHAILAAYQIETALDVKTAKKPPKIPSEAWQHIRDWAKRLADSHQPNMSQPIPATILAKVQKDFLARRQEASTSLKQIRSKIDHLSHQPLQTASTLARSLAQARLEEAQAKADVIAIV